MGNTENNGKMVDLNLTTSIITFTINGLNIPIKHQDSSMYMLST